MNKIAQEIRRRVACKNLNAPCNFTQTAYLEQGAWEYHAETEPHDHKRDGNGDAEWCVEFAYFSRQYRFMFWHGGKLRSIVPRLGKPYAFDCLKLHAVIRREHVGKFNRRSFWKRRFRDGEVSGPLACVFRFL